MRYVIDLRSMPEREGAAAYRAGISLDANPHKQVVTANKRGPSRHDDWRKGWLAGQAKDKKSAP